MSCCQLTNLLLAKSPLNCTMTSTYYYYQNTSGFCFFGKSGSAGEGRGGGGNDIPVYPKKIRQNTQNSSKYTQNYTQVYFIP